MAGHRALGTPLHASDRIVASIAAGMLLLLLGWSVGHDHQVAVVRTASHSTTCS